MKKKFLLSVFLSLILFSPAFGAGEDDATVLYNKGIDLYEQDKIEQSIATFKKAVAIDPNFYEAYYNLARIEEAAGKTQDAIASYEKLLKIAPDDYESTYQFGEFLYKKGYLSKSLSYLTKIPSTSEYGKKAAPLCEKIKKRQVELAEESKLKAAQSMKTSTVGNVQAPSGLVVDNKGNIYVASFTENKILKISKDGTQTLVADKTKGIEGPIGIAIDSYDNVYVANYTKGSVVVIDSLGKPQTLMYVKKPYGISIDENKGKLHITEQQNNSILSFDVSDILKNSQKTLKPEVKGEFSEIKPEPKVITVPKKDDLPLGVPSIQESNFTKNPSTSITAPIMIPSGSMFD